MDKKVIASIAGTVLLLVVYVFYTVSQLYTQDSKTTATAGIFFTKQLQLGAYKKISTGKDWKWFFKGQFNNYSRSDRHNELVTVYCNDFCK